MVLTATTAAPLHGRLTSGQHPALMRRLILVDRVRLVGAFVAEAGAVLAAFGRG